MDKTQPYAIRAEDYVRKEKVPTPATTHSRPRLMTQTDDRISNCIALG
jgi:hypothetical protein